MRLRLSAQAEMDLMDVHLSGLVLYGETAADAYVDGLAAELAWIAEWPLASRERTEVRPPVRVRRYEVHSIFYDAFDDRVVIVRVLHHSFDWMAGL